MTMDHQEASRAGDGFDEARPADRAALDLLFATEDGAMEHGTPGSDFVVVTAAGPG